MTDSPRARYDGLATRYEQYNAKAAKENRDALIKMLGSGEGWCLDVPVYREAGRHEAAPWWSGGGVRHQVGMRHLPLSDLVNGGLDAGLLLTHVREPREHAIPIVLAISARQPPA